jgi:outer membrane protein assembly factor BamB
LIRKVEEHPFARITGSPTLHDGRLYVPVSSYEEAQLPIELPLLHVRGSVTALDAATGRVIWKTYMIPDAPQTRGKSTAGVPLWGPRDRHLVCSDCRYQPARSTSRQATPTAHPRSPRVMPSSR